MRYISKHEADVYLDKGEKTQSGLRTEKKASTPVLSSNVKFGLRDQMEPIPVLAQCCGMVLYLLSFSLFLIENPEATSLTTNRQK